MTRPRARLTLPATVPFRNTTCCGLTWSICDVTLLSSPQQAHAPMMNSAPTLTDAPGSHTSSTPAPVTSSAAAIMLPPRCSRNSVAASTTVATNSMLSNSDAVAAGVSTSPAVSKAGPIAPPATIATANGRQSRRRASRSGRRAIHHGDTAIAAPRYSSPARTSGFMSSAMTDAAGVEAPKSTAASAQFRTPDLVTAATATLRPICRSASAGPARLRPDLALTRRPKHAR